MQNYCLFLLLLSDSESSTKISCFCLAVEQLSTLCNDATWCRKVTCLARALVAFASAIPTLPKYCDIPESGRQSLFHFIFIPLAVRKLCVIPLISKRQEKGNDWVTLTRPYTYFVSFVWRAASIFKMKNTGGHLTHRQANQRRWFQNFEGDILKWFVFLIRRQSRPNLSLRQILYDMTSGNQY